MFITFEGIEGSGKTTQIKLLAESLSREGRAVVVTREPGGTAIGDKIRAILLDGANLGMSPLAEALLNWAARAQHVAELVRPALKDGKIVLCDRFADSTTAYQGYARGVSAKTLAALRDMVLSGLKVDRTFLFDLPVTEGLRRARARPDKSGSTGGDRFENETTAFHEKVRAGFLDLARMEPERFVLLDAIRPVADLHRDVLAKVREWIK